MSEAKADENAREIRVTSGDFRWIVTNLVVYPRRVPFLELVSEPRRTLGHGSRCTDANSSWSGLS